MSGSIMGVRQSAELDHAFERNFFTRALIKKLSTGSCLRDFASVLKGRARIVFDPIIIDCDSNGVTDVIDSRGVCVSHHIRHGQLEWDTEKIEIRKVLSGQDTQILAGDAYGEILTENPLGVEVLKFLIDNPELIPDEYKGKIIIFWGTKYGFFNKEDSFFASTLRWDDHLNRWEKGLVFFDNSYLGHQYYSIVLK